MTLADILAGASTAADYAFNAPGDYMRGVISAGYNLDPSKLGTRMTSKDLMGWDDPNSWMDDIAGFGVDTITDPTNLIGGVGLGFAGAKLAKLAAPGAVKFGSRASDMADMIKRSGAGVFNDARPYAGEALGAGESIAKGASGKEWVGNWIGRQMDDDPYFATATGDALDQVGSKAKGFAWEELGGSPAFVLRGADETKLPHELAHILSKVSPTSTSPMLERMASNSRWSGQNNYLDRSLYPILDEMNAHNQGMGGGWMGAYDATRFLLNRNNVNAYANQMAQDGTALSPWLHAAAAPVLGGAVGYKAGQAIF